MELINRSGVVTVSNATIGHWLAAGCPQNHDRTLNLVMMLAWFAKDRRERAGRKTQTAAAARMERIKLAEAELHLRKLRGQLVDRAKATADAEAVGRQLTDDLENVGRRFGPDVAAAINEAVGNAIAKLKL